MKLAQLFGRYLRREGAVDRHRVPAHLPLDQLSFMAIDCESTGLDARRDRLLSFAAISIGPDLIIEDKPLAEVLVNPRIPIPARSTAVHGIDDRAVAQAPPFSDVFDVIANSMRNVVVVGHHVGFDLALIAAEAARAGRRWREPPFLDTALLLAGLGRRVAGLDLADIMTLEGLAMRGRRHTAAGDALLAADLFVAVAHRLTGRGRGTFAGAVACQKASP